MKVSDEVRNGLFIFRRGMRQGRFNKNQLGYLIKYKHIEPINMATWKADGGYRFEQGDVEKLEELYKDSLTLKEAAEFLSKSKTYVHNAAKDGYCPLKRLLKGNQLNDCT